MHYIIIKLLRCMTYMASGCVLRIRPSRRSHGIEKERLSCRLEVRHLTSQNSPRDLNMRRFSMSEVAIGVDPGLTDGEPPLARAQMTSSHLLTLSISSHLAEESILQSLEELQAQLNALQERAAIESTGLGGGRLFIASVSVLLIAAAACDSICRQLHSRCLLHHLLTATHTIASRPLTCRLGVHCTWSSSWMAVGRIGALKVALQLLCEP